MLIEIPDNLIGYARLPLSFTPPPLFLSYKKKFVDVLNSILLPFEIFLLISSFFILRIVEMKTTTVYNKTDVFPKTLSPFVRKLSEYPKFGTLIGQKDVKYFCLYMSGGNRIYYQRRALSQKVIESFVSHGLQAKVCKHFRPDTVKWSKVFQRYRVLPEERDGRNEDTRTGFKIENDYLVKAYFTFGQRRVEPGTAHVVQTLSVPILFFLRRPDRCRDAVADRLFPTNDLFKYDMRVLETDTCHRIPPGVVYVLFTLQKNFFRLDVVDERCEIPFDYVDPVERPVRPKDLYDEPVATPFIEELNEEEMPVEETARDDEVLPNPPAASEGGGEAPQVSSEDFNNFFEFLLQSSQTFFQPEEPSSFSQQQQIIFHTPDPFFPQQQGVFQTPESSFSQEQQQQQPQQGVFQTPESSFSQEQQQQQPQQGVFQTPESSFSQQRNIFQTPEPSVLRQQHQQGNVSQTQEPSVSQRQQQQQQPQTTFLPVFETRSVVRVTGGDFVSAYGNLTRKKMGDPEEPFVANDFWKPEPLDLTMPAKEKGTSAAAAAAIGEKTEGQSFVDERPMDLTMPAEEREASTGDFALESPGVFLSCPLLQKC